MAQGNGFYRMEQRFKGYDGESSSGSASTATGASTKGLVTDLVQRNAEVSIPFMVSSRGYGFCGTSPARVEWNLW